MASAKKAQTKVELTTKELKNFVKHIVENNRYLQERNKTPIAVNIEGESGIGKTSTLLQIVNELEIKNYIKLNLAQIEEIGDLVGFPVKEYKVQRDEEIKWVPESTIDYYVDKGFTLTDEKRMSHAAPEWIQGKGESGLLILDDYTRADSRLLQATMELIDRQEYISWKLPKDWHIVLTSNPDNGDYFVSSIDNAQKTRFITTYLKFDAECWAEWAEKNEIDTRCINFLLMNPELVSKQSNPRSITNFFNSISSFKDFENNLPMIQLIGEGCVGEEFANMFTTFINNNLDKLISPKDMLLADWKKVEPAIRDAIFTSSGYRSDIASVLAMRFSNYVAYYAETNTVTKDILERIKDMVKTEKLFQLDLHYAMIKKIVASNKTKFQPLMLDSQMVSLLVK